MSFVATTGGITAEDMRDLMVATVEHRFGQVDALPHAIEWLTDNGSCYTAQDTRRFARDVGRISRTTPVESPQSNGMAEAFVRTLPWRTWPIMHPSIAGRIMPHQIPGPSIYNRVRPHRALGYRSPREFIDRSTREEISGL
jgi:putative transposase